VTYTFMTLGAFMVLVYLGHEAQRPARVDGGARSAPEWQDAESFADLAGVARRHPWAALAMTIFVISLGGLPPTAGFAGKFTVFSAAIAQGHVAIVILGVAMSLVSLYYYLRVVVAMYMIEPLSSDERTDRSVGAVVALAAVATMAIGILPGTLYDWALRSITLLQG
jgi:NADH-quinone oxidoreductase subunit N